jgi:transglutaminase-like putative cysteine protease
MAKFEQYRHPQYHPDPQIREFLSKSFAATRPYYPTGSADAVLHHECIYLCAETADYIYSDEFTPKAPRYTPGSRPYLEEIARRLTDGITNPLKRACRIMDFVRDTFYHEPRLCYKDMLFYGGTEEDIIRKRTGMCNEIARVGCILAWIAGMPARLAGHDGPKWGHGTVEICVDGKWGWFDVRGQTFLNREGRVASVWELIQDYEGLLPLQPEWLKKRCLGYRTGAPAGRYSHEGSRLNFRDTHSFIANYDPLMAPRINFMWCWEKKSLQNFFDKDHTCWTYQPEDMGFQVDDIPGF